MTPMRTFSLKKFQEISSSSEYQSECSWDDKKYQAIIDLIFEVFKNVTPSHSVKNEVVVMGYHFGYYQPGLYRYIKHELKNNDIGGQIIDDVEKKLVKINTDWEDINSTDQQYHYGCFFMTGRGGK